MLRLLRLGIILTSLMALLFIFACEGDQGPQGPAGDPGEPGDPGQDISVAAPSDFYVSLAVFNQFDGTNISYRSQDFIKVTFDTAQDPSASVVVGSFLAKSPLIDGVDGDIDEWGNGEDIFESDIPLAGIVGDDIRISEVLVRCIYDARYIYFFLNWEEQTFGDLLEFEDRNLEEWNNDGVDLFVPLIKGSEDRVWIMFLSDPEYLPGTSDCLLECGLEEASFGSNLRIDVWDWRASLTDLVGFADDGYLIYEGGVISDFMADAGGAAFIRNEDNGLPMWMYYDDPDANGDYPFWFRNAVPFVNEDWMKNSKVPGYMALIPFGDRADVAGASAFESPKWTVELRRLRNTGSGNDIQF